jgi:PAS domain S-box-containing protein
MWSMPTPTPLPLTTPAAPLPGLNAIAWAAALGWTALITASLAYGLHQKHTEAIAFARSEAGISIDKDVLFRRWIALQGGVYVPPSDYTPPNPYLDLPERDVVTTTGKVLTLINPAYATRQVHELEAANPSGLRGHITSLKPIRPENAADAWETRALHSFETGTREVAEALTPAEGPKVFRIMRPFITDTSCLKCHASQGYKVGDIRGGISTTVALAPFLSAAHRDDFRQCATHGVFLLLGLGGIAFARRHITRAFTERQRAYSALFESENRNHQIFEKLPLYIVTCSPRGTLAYCNPALLDLCGRSSADTIGQNWFEVFIPREQRAADEATFRQALQAGTAPARAIGEIVTRDGQRRTVAWVSTLITDENGQPVGVTSLGEDITERRAEDLRLRLLERAVEHSPVSIVVTDREGRIEYVNEKFTQLTGYTRAEALGQNPRVLNSGRNPPELFRELWTALLAGSEWHGEFHNRKKNGELFWEDARISPIKDDAGAIVRFIALKEDITERKRSAQAAAESEQRFRALVENAPAAVIVHRAHRCIYANLAALRLFGYDDNASTSGLDIWLHLQPESIAVVADRESRLLAGEHLAPVELHLRQRDGTPIVCESTVTAIAYDGAPAALAILSDITERRQMTAALEESEERFRSFVEAAPLAIFTLVNGRFTYANPATAALFGFAHASDLVGQSLWSRVHADCLHCTTALVAGTEAGCKGQAVELKLLRRDSSIVLGETVGVPITFGSQPAVMAIVTDVTESKHLEQALLENEARMQETLESTSAGYFRLDSQDRLQHANSAWLQLFDQIDAASATGRPFTDLLPEPERDYTREVLRRLACGEEYVAGEFNHTRPDGSPGFYSFTAHLVREGDRLAGCEGFCLDTTAIRTSQERYQMLFEQMLDGFALHEIVCNAEGRPTDYRYLAVNPAFEKLMGRPAAAMIGRRVREVLPSIEEKWITRYGQLALGGEPLRIEDYSRELDRHFEILAFRPSPGRFATLVRDVTARHRLESQLQQAQKMDAVGQLAGGVAHDFNNILVAILMNLSLLRSEANLSEETVESLKALEQEAKRATTLTRQLLVFSRRRAVESRPVDLNDLLEAMVKMLRRLLGEHVTIATVFAPGLPPIQADPGMIDQIVMNLCVNARDAMPKGGLLQLTTTRMCFTEADHLSRPVRRPGDFLRLSVSDTGCGMDAATLSHLFEPFFTTKEVGQGTGMGLSTVFGIVAQHGGWLEAESIAGQGSTFHAYLPVAHIAACEAPASAHPATPTGGTETILLVEDDTFARQTVSLALRRDGYTVIEADNFAGARTAWQQHRAAIAALVTDVVMPGGQSGIELARGLRAESPQLSIVIVSGYNADTGDIQPPVERATYLPKPFDYTTLTGVLRASFARKV